MKKEKQYPPAWVTDKEDARELLRRHIKTKTFSLNKT